MLVNHEIKSQLAKLLATEDLIVENKNVETAAFNTHTRVLTLPTWDRASNNVYDSLVAHEVGHALYTPDTEWWKEVKINPSIVNIVEDARVEKLMKRRYGGIAKTFHTGYNELFDQDFFQIQHKDVSTMGAADRVNLFYKVGSFIDVPFNLEEKIKSLEIIATNSAGPIFAISSYSDSNGSYYLMGANLSYQTNGNFGWETNGEHMSGVVLDSRVGHGVTFVDSYYDSNTTAYVPAEIGKVHTSLDARADLTVDATGLAGSGGLNANAFFNAKAKGYYYAGLDIKSSDGHVGGWIGHWNGGSSNRNLQARVGGTGINASDYQAIYADYLGRVTHPQRPHFRVRGFPSHRYVNVIQSAEDGRLRNWNSVDVNRGSHFDNTSGKFTIPVTGDYAFYCTVMYTNPSTMDFHLTFKLNGATLTASNDHNGGGSGQGHQWNGTTLCYSGYFSANDYVGYSITGGGTTSTVYLYQSNTYNVMGGYLL